MLAEGNIHLGNWDIIEKFINKSMEIEPAQSGCHYLEYRLAEYQEDYSRGLSSLEILLNNTKNLQRNSKKISTDTLLSLSDIYKTIAQTYVKLDDKSKALINYQSAWDESNDTEFLPKIIGCAREIGDWKTLAKHLEFYVDRTGITAESLDLYGLTLINLNRLQEALNIYLELIQMVPDEVGVIRIIAGLYAKLGDTENAQNWVIVLNEIESKA